MIRGQLAGVGDHWVVVVSTDSLADVLPTCWALLATTNPGPLNPPLVVALAAAAAGDDHPALWIRTTQIRTVATGALRLIGPVPAHILHQLDQTLTRLLDIQIDPPR